MGQDPLRIDADELLAATGSPKLVVGGEEYEGRFPSFKERWEIEKRLDDWDPDNLEQQNEFVEFLAEKFGVPADVLKGLPEHLLSEVIIRFLAIMRGIPIDADLIESSPSNTGSES